MVRFTHSTPVRIFFFYNSFQGEHPTCCLMVQVATLFLQSTASFSQANFLNSLVMFASFSFAVIPIQIYIKNSITFRTFFFHSKTLLKHEPQDSWMMLYRTENSPNILLKPMHTRISGLQSNWLSQLIVAPQQAMQLTKNYSSIGWNKACLSRIVVRAKTTQFVILLTLHARLNLLPSVLTKKVDFA